METGGVRSHFTGFGMDIDMSDVCTIEDVEYKVPRFMSKDYCLKYGLSHDSNEEFWIVPYTTGCKSEHYCYFKDEPTAKLAHDSLIHALEQYHSDCAAAFDKELEDSLDI